MKTAQEIKAEIRSVKREMREQGVRVISCFNAGLTGDERSFNTTLFRLKTELLKAS